MESRKRKLSGIGLQRRVRARAEPEPDLDDFEDETGSAPSHEDVDEDDSAPWSASEREGDSDDPVSHMPSPRKTFSQLLTVAQDESAGSSSDEDEEEEGEGISIDASKVSFGALAKAQAMLPQAGRRKKKDALSEANGGDDRDEDSGPRGQPPSKKKDKAPSRSSKHAPTEVSSKRPVSRKREIIAVKQAQARDPRFDPLVTSRSSFGAGAAGTSRAAEDHARRAYAFLDEYRDDEMRQLRAAVKRAKAPAEKEKLQRALTSMESRKRARERKDRERAVVEEHRRQEKELVREGKKAQPFYLKRSEQKKQLLLDQFAGLSEKQRDKAIEKKRKKIAGKEKKSLPMERRMRE